MCTLTVAPYRYASSSCVVNTPSIDGYKTRAARLCEAVGLRYVHRARGYVGSSTAADRARRLHAAGWDAHCVHLGAGGATAPGVQLPEPWMHRRSGLWIAPQPAAVSAP